MESPRNPMSRAPGKLKMVDCKAILGCTDKEWTEIGAIVQHLMEFSNEFSYSRSQKNSIYLQRHGLIRNMKALRMQPYVARHF